MSPLSLTQNEATESGHDYADVLGISYEYPNMYRNLVQVGERFVYYRGRRTERGPHQPQAYLGTGIIGPIEDSERPGLLKCTIKDFHPFTEPLFFKSAGRYFEQEAGALGPRAGLHFRRGVRRLTEPEYDAILRAADPDTPDRGTGFGFPDADRAVIVDEVAMEIALAAAAQDFPDARIRRMAHNNPGFDILVSVHEGCRYIEVKGASGARPRFFLTEGERCFSEANGHSYSIWVIHSIDTTARTGTVEKRDGPLSQIAVTLVPVQWTGELV